MKTALAILMCFIISEAPVLAIHGGYTLGGDLAAAVGTYAGVLVPTSSTTLGSGTSTNFGSNSLGLFTMSVPQTGIGSGTMAIFSGNDQLNGSIQALPDPNNVGGIVGVVQVSAYETVFTASVSGNGGSASEIVQQLTSEGDGQFSVGASQNPQSDSPTGVDISGTADVTYSSPSGSGTGATTLTPGAEVIYAISGFQQSTTPSSSGGGG